ncbi:MAG: hypothetical protein M1325_04465 [Actinobacteria bacterium]|nr:hypothetical protein [Actinomycetota bacterium]
MLDVVASVSTRHTFLALARVDGSPITTGVSVSVFRHTDGMWRQGDGSFGAVRADLAPMHVALGLWYIDLALAAGEYSLLWHDNPTGSVVHEAQAVTVHPEDRLVVADLEPAMSSALAAYDPPTKAEFDAGLAALNDPSPAEIRAEIEASVKLAMKSDIDALGASEITTSSPVSAAGDIELVQGDDYAVADLRSLEWSSTGWPDLTGAAIAFRGRRRNGTLTAEIAGSVVTPTGTALVRVELTAAQTAAMDAGAYTYELEATLATGRTITLARGTLTVLPQIVGA